MITLKDEYQSANHYKPQQRLVVSINNGFVQTGPIMIVTYLNNSTNKTSGTP